mmetsp:Transcript_82335/g.191182  ORF Transcript_82335/g.191182 Transcript_82335/m.191182 type:complete len:302 (+) Transcript_82335:124-1029(+)
MIAAANHSSSDRCAENTAQSVSAPPAVSQESLEHSESSVAEAQPSIWWASFSVSSLSPNMSFIPTELLNSHSCLDEWYLQSASPPHASLLCLPHFCSFSIIFIIPSSPPPPPPISAVIHTDGEILHSPSSHTQLSLASHTPEGAKAPQDTRASMKLEPPSMPSRPMPLRYSSCLMSQTPSPESQWQWPMPLQGDEELSASQICCFCMSSKKSPSAPVNGLMLQPTPSSHVQFWPPEHAPDESSASQAPMVAAKGPRSSCCTEGLSMHATSFHVQFASPAQVPEARPWQVNVRACMSATAPA